MNLKEAGNVVMPNHRGTGEGQGALGTTVLRREKGEDVYVLYEDAEEEEEEEEEEGGGVNNAERTAKRNALSPPRIRRKSAVENC